MWGRLLRRGFGAEKPRLQTIVRTVQAPTPFLQVALPWAIVLGSIAVIVRD